MPNTISLNFSCDWPAWRPSALSKEIVIVGPRLGQRVPCEPRADRNCHQGDQPNDRRTLRTFCSGSCGRQSCCAFTHDNAMDKSRSSLDMLFRSLGKDCRMGIECLILVHWNSTCCRDISCAETARARLPPGLGAASRFVVSWMALRRTTYDSQRQNAQAPRNRTELRSSSRYPCPPPPAGGHDARGAFAGGADSASDLSPDIPGNTSGESVGCADGDAKLGQVDWFVDAGFQGLVKALHDRRMSPCSGRG